MRLASMLSGGTTITIWILLGSCRRRWYVLVIGLACTAAALAYISAAPGVYWARSQVILLGPPVPTRPNKLDSSSAGLIATAGLIGREMNIGRTQIPATNPEVSLADQGVYDGEEVRQPNYGGQWASNFSDPVLDIQATGHSASAVRQRMDALIAQAQTILDRRQDEAAVQPLSRITLVMSPAQVQVNYATGQHSRASLVAALTGAGVSVALTSMLDGRLTTRRTRVTAQRAKALGKALA